MTERNEDGMEIIPTTELKENLPRVLEEINLLGKSFQINKNGKPIATLSPVDGGGNQDLDTPSKPSPLTHTS